MKALLKQLHNAQNTITAALETPNEKYEFYQNFFKKYDINSFKNILKIDRADLAIAITAASDDSEEIDEIAALLQANSEFFRTIDESSINDFLEIIDALEDADILDDVLYNLQHGIRFSKLKRFLSEENYNTEALAEVATSFGCTPQYFASFIDFLRNEREKYLSDVESEDEIPDIPIYSALNFISFLNEAEREHELSGQAIDNLITELSDLNASPKALKRLSNFTDQLRGYNPVGFVEELAYIRKYYEKLASAEKSRLKTLNRQKRNYELLENQIYLDTQHPDRIIKIPSKQLAKIQESDIRKSTLRVIYKHNLALCAAKQAEYEEATANDTPHYQVLLAKYGISPNQYEIGTILQHSLKDIEAMLQQLTRRNITEPKTLLNIIQVSNLETINNYSSLIDKGIITSNLLTGHLSLFDYNSKDYQNMMHNLQTIQNNELNPYYFTTSEEVLITPYQSFQHNIDTLKNYQLTASLHTGIDASFLAAQDLTDALDMLLELGYETTLEDSLDLLNYRDKFNRLHILKALNMKVTSKEELVTVLTTDKFYLPDDQITNYIYNAAIHNLPSNISRLETERVTPVSLEPLSEFSKTSRTYNIGGVTISKNRVQRNLNSIKQTGNPTNRLLYSILNGATLTDEEVTAISTSLSPKKDQQLVKR